MEDKQEYLTKYLNSKSNLLSSLIDAYLKSTKKGDLYYYEELISDLIGDSIKLSNSLEIDTLPVNNFYNLLTIYKQKIKFLNEYNINSYSFIYRINYRLTMLKIKFNKLDNISHFEEFLIRNDAILNCDKRVFYEYFLNQTFLQVNKLSSELTFILIKNWINYLLNSHEIKVELGSKNRVSNSKITISQKDFDNFYIEGNYKIILTIYKAICTIKHSKYKNLKSKHILDDYLKDQILANLLEGYYEENKKKLSYQYINEIFAMEEVTKLFKRLNLEFDSTSYLTKITNYKKVLKNKNRIYQKQEQSLNEIYDKYILKDDIKLKKIEEIYD